jgi:predicted PurR-regulated permease PerM
MSFPAPLSLEDRKADLLFAGGVGVGLLVCALLYLRFPTIVLVWFLSATISYAVVPLVDRMSRRIPRSLAVAVIAVAAVGGIVGGLLLFAPAVVTQLAHLPTAFGVVRKEIEPRMAALGRWLPAGAVRLVEWAVDSTRSRLASAEPNPETLSAWAGRAAGAVSAVTTGILLVPLFVVMMLQGYHHFLASVADLVPPRWRERCLSRVAEADDVLSGFVRGQLVVALVLIALYGAAFSLVGIPLALLVAIFAGIGELVPYLGGFIAVSFGSLMAVAGGRPGRVLWVLVAYATIQTVQGIFISPWIVGQKVKLSPVTVIVALAIGADLLGFVGLLAAVPATALLKVAVRALVCAYRNTSLFSPLSLLVLALGLASGAACSVDRNVLLTAPAGGGEPNRAAELLGVHCPVAPSTGGFSTTADRFDLLAPPVGARRIGVRVDRGAVHLSPGREPALVWAARVVGRSSASEQDAGAVRDSAQLVHAVDAELVAAAVLGSAGVRTSTGDSEICVVGLVPPGYEVAVDVGVGQASVDGLTAAFQLQVTSGTARVLLAGSRLAAPSAVSVELGAAELLTPPAGQPFDASLTLQLQAGGIILTGGAPQFPGLTKQPLGNLGELATGQLGAGGEPLVVSVGSGRISLGPRP